MSYEKNKKLILNYIEKTELYKKFCEDIKENNKAFKDSVKCLIQTGCIDSELVNLYMNTLESIINFYDSKLNDDSNGNSNSNCKSNGILNSDKRFKK